MSEPSRKKRNGSPQRLGKRCNVNRRTSNSTNDDTDKSKLQIRQSKRLKKSLDETEQEVNAKPFVNISTASYSDQSGQEKQLPTNKKQVKSPAVAAANKKRMPADKQVKSPAVAVSSKKLNHLFWIAARDGNIDLARRYIAEGAKINSMYKGRYSVKRLAAIHIASKKGHLEVVKLIVNEEADSIEAICESGLRAIHYASLAEGGSAIVGFLIKNKANIHAVDKYGRDPLMWAAMYGQEETVRLLINSGANFEAADESGRTAIHYASMYGKSAVVELLVKNKANIHAVDKDGCSPIIWAADHGFEKIVQFLINSGANTEAVNKKGCTAMHTASYKYRIEVVECLISNNANINAVDQFGCLPLHYASMPQVAKILIDGGSKTDIANKDGNTVLHTSALFGFGDVFSYFVSKGLNLYAKNKAGNIPLDILQTEVKDDDMPVCAFIVSRMGIAAVNSERKRCAHMFYPSFST